MATDTKTSLRELEGRRVSIALANGSRLDDCMLVSAGRGRSGTAWIFADGLDVFVPLAYVVDVWEG